jgi:hypothetical protein
LGKGQSSGPHGPFDFALNRVRFRVALHIKWYRVECDPFWRLEVINKFIRLSDYQEMGIGLSGYQVKPKGFYSLPET